MGVHWNWQMGAQNERMCAGEYVQRPSQLDFRVLCGV